MQTEKSKLQKEVSKSNDAQAIIESPLFKDSIKKLKELYTDSLFKTGVNEEKTREKLWLAYQVVGKVEQHFIELVETGKLASKQLEDFRTNIKNKKF